MSHFDQFMKAVEAEPDRYGVLGGCEALCPPIENPGYECWPTNAVAFGAMGVDGVHYAIVKIDGRIRDDSPVVQISPMDFEEPVVFLAGSFLEYLSIACGANPEETEILLSQSSDSRAQLLDMLSERMNHALLLTEERLGLLWIEHAHKLEQRH